MQTQTKSNTEPSTLPWVEKYRPDNIDDIISHKEIINTLTNLISNSRIPHMIFYGPPGTGKTTTILACAKKIYGANYRSMILELNGSDDRGINVVREQIKNFSATDSKISSLRYTDAETANASALVSDKKSNSASNSTLNSTYPNIKLVILDEADAMTYDAQFALRRVVELYTDSTRFCLICNYLTKIIPALQSRCQMFRFAPINNMDHLARIQYIIQAEKINIDKTTAERIVELSEGDMRKSLNLLQSLYMINGQKQITLDIVYKLIGYPTDKEREKIISSLENQTLQSTYNILNRLQIDNNLSNQDILREISTHYGRTHLQECKKLNPKSKISEQNRLLDLFDDMAKIEINLATNTNPNIHLLAISSVINNYTNKS